MTQRELIDTWVMVDIVEAFAAAAALVVLVACLFVRSMVRHARERRRYREMLDE